MRTLASMHAPFNGAWLVFNWFFFLVFFPHFVFTIIFPPSYYRRMSANSRRSNRSRPNDTPKDRLARAGEVAASATFQRKKAPAPPTVGPRAEALKKQHRQVSMHFI